MDPAGPPQAASAPRSAERESRRLAATLRAVGLTFLLVLLLLLLVSFTLFPNRPGPTGLALLGGVLSLIGVSLWLVRVGRVRLSAHVLVWMTWLACTVGMVLAGGIGTPGFGFYAVTIVAAGLLLGGPMAAGMTLLSAVAGAVVGMLEAQGRLPTPLIQYDGVASLWWIEMTLLSVTASLIYVSVGQIREAIGDAERSERDLETRNRELSRTLAAKRRAEAAEALLHEAMGQAREAILVVDVQRRVRFVNSSFEALTGLVAAEISGRDILDFFADLRHVVGPDVLPTLRDGRAWHGRVPLSHPRERLVDASFSSVRDARGRTTHFVALARDVTREAALESDLRQAQKLEALGQLAGGVAHDFNNLLAVIQGYAEIVRDGQSDPEMREFVGRIEEAARQAASLTSQLLAFGRRQLSHPRVVDLNSVVREADGMLRALVPEDIEICVDLDPDLGRVRLDPRQVHQILLNLASNARDAMPHGGRLEIQTQRRPGDRAALRVNDDGAGMDDETREHIFEPFFTTKGPGEGTGLGLASVYGIVEQCGGSVEVESAPGRGSRFRIEFPCTRDRIESSPGLRVPGDPDRRASILVVEDQAGVRGLLGRQLERAGFAVALATDGVAALEWAERPGAGLDLLVTDVTMPRLGGAALAERLRARWPGLRLLYISGYWPEDLVAQVEADLRADFLAKPFSHRELVAKVERLLAVEPLA